MKKPIVEVLVSSEKRRNMLLLLLDGPKEMETILNSLKTNRTALLPQIKILKESHLISKYEDIYKLITIGKLIVEEMIVFLEITNMFGENRDYLGTHFIDFIPTDLLKKLPQLGSCNIIDIPIGDLFDAEKDFFEKAIMSKYWFQITSTLHPVFHEFYVEMIDQGTDVSIIFTQEIYEKIKHDYYDDFKELIDIKLISFYVYPKDLEFVSFILADQSINFRLFTQEGESDNKKMLFSSPASLEWGKELFEYYRQQSIPIIEI
ncbi:winged helix-turn-helix domain-containing protein [uncultured Methanomethylovorans sp.]|uniref:helix-turn-helix transcriptional regulator n=1 Tax=uncultured Methanomethylovorans sp. TaxID=183759 RepID=UPI002AA90C84|nr:winged helix-turn-helix domain-containing protein [uncultured Methanomethylovorans sp.]